MGIPAIDRAITIAQQFLKQTELRKHGVLAATIPIVALPPVGSFESMDDYVAHVAKQVSLEQFLGPEELLLCQQMKPAYDQWAGRQGKALKIGVLVGVAAVGISAYVNPDSLSLVHSFFIGSLRNQ